MNEHVNEDELIRLIICDDRKAFARLYTLYIDNLYKYLYSICRSEEISEEIVQEIFIRIWENRAKLADISSFKSYIFRCAKNALLNHIKKVRIESTYLHSIDPDFDKSDSKTDDRIIDNQNNEIAQKAINQLSKKRKEIFELRAKEGLTLDEISIKLSISKGVVKKQFYTSRSIIKEYLHNAGIIHLIWILSVNVVELLSQKI
jgi:RNA polymerase sigma-70 factor (family 1)